MKIFTTRTLYFPSLSAQPIIYFINYSMLCMFLLLAGSWNLNAQNISFDNLQASDLMVCSDGDLFSVELSNVSGSSLSNVEVSIDFPNGIDYVPGSLTESSTFNLQEQNISNLSSVVFSLVNLPAGATLNFNVESVATFDSYSSQLNGEVFLNTVSVQSSAGADSEVSDPYNVLYPALSIVNVDPMSATVFVGGTFTRTVTVVNGGYGKLSEIKVTEIDEIDLHLDAVDAGVFDVNTGILLLGPADFATIGNNDGYFDQNESFTFTQTLTAVGCNSAQSKITAYWGCDGQTSASNDKFPYTTINLYPPNMALTPQPSFNTCVDGSPNIQQLMCTNNGTGPANEMEVLIRPIEQHSVTEIDPASISYTLNGTTVSLSASSTTPAYDHSCFMANPIDGFNVTLPTIQPGETLILNWNTNTCASESCGAVHYYGWDYESSYTDMCNSKTYEVEGEGQPEKEKGFSTFFESPSDLVDGQVGTYSFIISSATFNLPEGNDPFFEVVFNIPDGLVWNGGVDDLTYMSNVNTWAADQIDYNAGTKELTARYDMPIPASFYLNHSVFNLNLTADCTPGVSWATVGMQMFYTLDANCSNPYRLKMTCYETPQTQLHCPGNCAHGMGFSNFEIERTSFGGADNNLDGLPDVGGTLDLSKVKLNRVMKNDTFETTFTGTVKTSATFPSWAYGYAQSSVPYGASIAVHGARVEILDVSTGMTLTCDQVPFTEQLTGDTRNVDFDFSSATLAALGCSDFSGFVMEDTDQVKLIATYELVENIGGTAQQIMIQNSFYVSDTPNGTAYQCNDWNGNFTVIGYYHASNWAEQYDIRTCTKTLSQTYKLSIGDCCTNYAGGNIFPYEYRNWSHLRTLNVDIPDGYSFVSGYVDQWRTAATNSTVKETAAIFPESNPGSPASLAFNMENYLVENGGTINKSDDGYNGVVYIELEPNCNVNQAANNPVSWFFSFQENDFIGGTITDDFTYPSDYLKYYRSKLKISSTLPTQEGIAPTVTWNIKIKTQRAHASNGWFYLENPAENINILEVKNTATNTVITPVDGFYQIGDLSWGAVNNFQITASYDDCNLSTLSVVSGHGCAGYPTNIDDYDCASESFLLYMAPQPSELQTKFNSYINPDDECSNIIGIELEMLSSKLAVVNDLLVNVLTPSGQTITIEDGSMEVLYPAGGNYATLPNPTLTNNQYTITGMDMDAVIGTDGLVGVTDLSSNLVKLRFNILLSPNFQPGDILDIDISGKRPCGDALPVLAMSYDPNASFGALTGVGLDDTSNNWAAAWGDYDNDGNVDLFVTNYETTEANLLYHNNGDGTFSRVTTGAIVTDLASSLGASWGDYDNDGDLDLYVANNIGFPNFLYRNNGNSSFTKISNDPIVTDLSYAHGVSWVDYDKDGFLDMFVTDYFSTKFNKIFRNNGDGTFSKETNAAPVLEASNSVSGVWGDYNNDGYPDLFVANTENQNNSLYENKGNGQFLRINTGAIVSDGGSSVGASWGDYNNDGHLDLFVANAGNQNNFLYKNNGDGSFTKITSGVVATDGGHSHGSAWADYDNDGDLDLFVSNDQGQDNFLYSNNGDGTFTKTVNEITQDSGDSFGAAWADFDNDGDVDLFVSNHDSNENFVYENSRGKCQNKSCITLVGTSSNKSAVGSRIYLKANIYGQTIWQMREITAQSGGGIGGQSELKVIFGLGNASSIDSIIVEWNSGYRQTLSNPTMNDCLTITEENAAEICGVAYYDANGNCTQDNTEPGLDQMKLIVQPGNRVVMTDENGNYSIAVETGTYTISEDASGSNWAATCVTERTVEVTTIGESYCGYDFSNSALCAEPDLVVEMSTTAHRVGFENLIALTYKNVGGAVATNVALTVAFGEFVVPMESSVPWDLLVGTDRRWNLGDVGIGESSTIYIKDSISTNAIVGEDILMTATLYGNEADCMGTDNMFQSTQPAVGAIDPNDISVSPEGYIDAGDELVYKIRFQNVGNTIVSTVRIEDELPEYLDMTSFKQGVTSHPYNLRIEGNKVVWTFENINMPDSLSNEPESHGFILFKIKTKSVLADQTKIENSAAIYFDFVAPMITNTVINTIGSPAGNINEEGVLAIIPNPMVDQSMIEIIPFGKEKVNIQAIYIFDMVGHQMYQREGMDERRFQLERNRLESGCYILKAIGANGDEFVGKLFVR